MLNITWGASLAGPLPCAAGTAQAIAAPMAAKQRVAEKAVVKAEETLKRVQEHRSSANNEPTKQVLSLPKVAASIEQVAQAVEAARQEHQRLTEQRAQVTQSMRAIGHAYHFVDLERGVRRNGKLIAGDIQQHINTIRTIVQQAHLSETCMERLEKAEREVAKMQTTIEFVSGMCASKCANWTWRRPRLTPCTPISFPPIISIV